MGETVFLFGDVSYAGTVLENEVAGNRHVSRPLRCYVYVRFGCIIVSL